MFNDCPNCIYENPPPPSDDFEYDFDFSSIVFTFPRPQYVPNVEFIKVDRSLIHPSRFIDKEEYKQVSNETKGKCKIIEGVEALNSETLKAEVPVNINALEEGIDRNKVSKDKFVKNDALDKTKDKRTISQKDDSTSFPEKKKRGKQKNRSKDEKKNYIDSDNSKNGKKKKSVTKVSAILLKSALDSISKAYSISESALDSISKVYSISESDSDNSEKHKTKSSSHRAKSHSKKSSQHRKEDKDSRNDTTYSDVIPYYKVGLRSSELSVKQEISSDEESLRSSFSKKTEITVKKEVLSDDDNKKDKMKSSKKVYDDSRRHNNSRSRKDSRRRDNSRSRRNSRLRDDSRSRDDSRNRYYDEGSCSSRNSNPWEMKQEIKLEPGTASCYGPNDYYCDVCKLNLNSETTYSSHMAGKRHTKALRQLSEQEVAKSTVLEITESQSFPKPLDMDRNELYNERSRIQNTCEEADNLLIVGLNYVREIRGYQQTKYFCELCSAQCVSNSIMKHLTGFKHKINCLKTFCYRSYISIKDLEKRDPGIDRELKLQLEEERRLHGIGRIRVFEDVRRNPRGAEPYDPYQPSTSRQCLDNQMQDNKTGELKVSEEDCLSRNFSDFYCRVCKTHMNCSSLWESHARGKRHAKNKKKAPAGLVTNSNFIEAPPGTISHLEELIEDQCDPNDIIVGLNFIRENQGENGDLYNCYLCGSVCPTVDIVNHLYLMKHKTKYLEKMNSDGYANSINEISSFSIGDIAREGLINEECSRLLKDVGRGRPVIGITKKIF